MQAVDCRRVRATAPGLRIVTSTVLDGGYGDVLTGLMLTPMGLRVSRKRSDVDLGREQAFAGVKQLRGECDVSLRTLR